MAVLSGREEFPDQEKVCYLQVWGKLELEGKGEKPLFRCTEMSIGPEYSPLPAPGEVLLAAFDFW